MFGNYQPSSLKKLPKLQNQVTNNFNINRFYISNVTLSFEKSRILKFSELMPVLH